MLREQIKAATSEYYTKCVLTHGPTHWGVDWNSTESQNERFARLVQNLNLSQPYSLLDYGCGYGALLQFLEQRGVAPARYQGFDISAAMVQAAQAATFQTAEASFTDDERSLNPADYVVSSGVFNVKGECSTVAWEDYIKSCLAQMLELTQHGLAVNFLTSFSDAEYKKPHLYYADPGDWLNYFLARISRNAVLQHGFGLYEFTISCVLSEEGKP